MLNESMALKRLRIDLGDDLFDGLDQEWLLGILNDKTLVSFSLFYPKIVKNIVITVQQAILTRHPQNGDLALYQYKIPTESEDLPYIGIEQYYFPGNNLNDRYTGLAPTMVDTLMGSIRSILPTPQIRYAVNFEPPDIAIVDPIPRLHRDFTLDMQRVRRLNEFPMYFYDMLMSLYIADVQAAIYAKYKNARDSATIGGVEIQTFISDYSGAKDTRDSLLETYRKDYYKNPERFQAMLSWQ